MENIDMECLELLQEIAEENDALESAELTYSELHEDSPEESTDAQIDSIFIETVPTNTDESIQQALREYKAAVRREATRKMKQTVQRKKQIKRLSILDLRRRILMADAEALSFSLYDRVSSSELQELIKILTQSLWDTAEYYRAFAQKRLATYLNTLMPKGLKNAKKLYPQAFVAYPGFPYKTKSGLCLWMRLDIPYYFEQFSEQSLLQQAGYNLAPIDRAIERFFKVRRELAKAEITYAAKLRRCVTYMDVLQQNPYWLTKLKPELETLATK